MSLSKVSVMLSMALSASAVSVEMVSLGMVSPCERWVEDPSGCRAQPGCMVKNTWDCVPVPESPEAPHGIVWLQHPTPKSLPGLPPLKPLPDTKVPGHPVEGILGGPDFSLDDGIFVDKFPEFLKDTHFHAVPAIEKHGGLKFECPERETKGFCDFFVAVFTCAPCSNEVNGGLPALLTVSNGFEARSCAPSLRVSHDDDDYKMTIFRVRVEDGHFVETPRLPRSSHLVAVFSSNKETELCPVPVRAMGPFSAGKKCGGKCPFHFPVDEVEIPHVM